MTSTYRHLTTFNAYSMDRLLADRLYLAGTCVPARREAGKRT